MATLTFAISACAFDHSGALSGSSTGADDDASDEGARDGGDANRSDAAREVGDEAESATEASSESSSSDGSSSEGAIEGSDAAQDAPADTAAPIDQVAPGDVRLPEGGSLADAATEAGVDAAPDNNPPGNCTARPNGATFTPPGAASAHCYWTVVTPANWLAAANRCATDGGHLVTVSSASENAFVSTLIPGASPITRVWIGGTDGRFSSDGQGSGPYSWITGEPFAYVNWFSDPSVQEPDGLCSTCQGTPCYCEHRMAMRGDGRWVDAYEALAYGYICESGE